MTTTVYAVQVQCGDCGPDRIVLPYNFTRWMDAASQHYFLELGVPPGCRITQPAGLLCMQAVELHMRFHTAATESDVLLFHTRVDAWHPTVFVQSHRVLRGDTLIGELHETRAFFCLDGEGDLQALPIPEWIRSRCH